MARRGMPAMKTEGDKMEFVVEGREEVLRDLTSAGALGSTKGKQRKKRPYHVRCA
jgi:hypothetical protein